MACRSDHSFCSSAANERFVISWRKDCWSCCPGHREGQCQQGFAARAQVIRDPPGLMMCHAELATPRPPGLAVSGAICLKLCVRPTHYHYHYYYHLHPFARRFAKALTRHLHIAVDCTCCDRRSCRPQVVDGVRHCVGKVQVVRRHPWMLAVFRPTQQSPSTFCCVQTAGGRLVSRTGSTPSSPDSTDSGASQQGWSGTG